MRALTVLPLALSFLALLPGCHIGLQGEGRWNWDEFDDGDTAKADPDEGGPGAPDTDDEGGGSDSGGGSGTDSGSGSGTDSGGGSGTDSGGGSGTDSGGGGEATCPTTSDSFAWVITELEVGSGTEGVDLDGDGAVDNVLAIAASALNDSIAEAFAQGPQVLALQFWNLSDWCNDDFEGGILVAEDLDGNTADNGSGAERFDAGDEVDGSGHARDHAPGRLSGSRFEADVPSAAVEVGGVMLQTATPIHIEGTADVREVSGRFGFGVAVEALLPYAEEAGLSSATVEALADLDTDGDGHNDAVSAGFVFAGASCRLE